MKKSLSINDVSVNHHRIANNYTHSEIFIIADDFTGANDIGIGFVDDEVEVTVILDTQNHVLDLNKSHSAQPKIKILCTDSRDDDAQDARKKIGRMLEQSPYLLEQKILIKKVDSTLRGNIGAEIEALAGEEYPLIVMAMAAPKVERKTLGGCCYVKGKPLVETEFASDPKSPVLSSRIRDIVSMQTDLKIDELFIDDVRAASLSQQILASHQLNNRIIICDAETQQDLALIYQALLSAPLKCLLVTTGDMGEVVANGLKPISPSAVIPPQVKKQTLPLSRSPVLAVIGSMSKITLTQIQQLEKLSNVGVIDIDIELLLAPSKDSYINAMLNNISTLFAQSKHCVLRTCKDEQQRYEVTNVAQRLGCSRQALGNRVKQALAEITEKIIAIHSFGALILCGGDIALATSHQLNIKEFYLKGVVAKCVPWGYLSHHQLASTPVFTKAGGFGESATLQQVINFIEKEEL